MSGGSAPRNWKPVHPTLRFGGGSDECDVDEVTILNSPDRAVLARLGPGTILNIEIAPGLPVRLVAKHRGDIAGSITSGSKPQIVACIHDGRQYDAHVLAVRGAICQVRVRLR